jgi:hypothetical protein
LSLHAAGAAAGKDQTDGSWCVHVGSIISRILSLPEQLFLCKHAFPGPVYG